MYKRQGFTETTVGLLIFNENIPQDLGFIDRSKAENALKFEVDVYKRQAAEEKTEFDVELTEVGPNKVKAVSYTHIDVYKRQGVG